MFYKSLPQHGKKKGGSWSISRVHENSSSFNSIVVSSNLKYRYSTDTRTRESTVDTYKDTVLYNLRIEQSRIEFYRFRTQ